MHSFLKGLLLPEGLLRCRFRVLQGHCRLGVLKVFCTCPDLPRLFLRQCSFLTAVRQGSSPIFLRLESLPSSWLCFQPPVAGFWLWCLSCSFVPLHI